jgi:hypothetical protein
MDSAAKTGCRAVVKSESDLLWGNGSCYDAGRVSFDS